MAIDMCDRVERVADDIPCPGTRVHEDWLKYLLEDGKKAVQHRDHWHVIPAAFKITGWLPAAHSDGTEIGTWTEQSITTITSSDADGA